MADTAVRYRQEGKFWDRPPGTALAAGEPEAIGAPHGTGVADNDIAANEQGALRICGVYAVPNPDKTAFALGAAVQWDATNKKAVAVGDVDLGSAFNAYVAGDAYVYVLLNDRVS